MSPVNVQSKAIWNSAGMIIDMINLNIGARLCMIIVASWLNKLRPTFDLIPFATTVIFARFNFQSLKLSGVFRIPKVSTVPFEKDDSSNGFFLDHLGFIQLFMMWFYSDWFTTAHPLPESWSQLHSLLPIVIFMFCGAISFVSVYSIISKYRSSQVSNCE